jgi:hypothetical protein
MVLSRKPGNGSVQSAEQKIEAKDGVYELREAQASYSPFLTLKSTL